MTSARNLTSPRQGSALAVSVVATKIAAASGRMSPGDLNIDCRPSNEQRRRHLIDLRATERLGGDPDGDAVTARRMLRSDGDPVGKDHGSSAGRDPGRLPGRGREVPDARPTGSAGGF